MKKIVQSFIVIVVTSYLAVGSTIAAYSDVETALNNDIVTGTMNLAVNGTDGQDFDLTPPIHLSDLVPGDAGSVMIQLVNSGSLNGMLSFTVPPSEAQYSGTCTEPEVNDLQPLFDPDCDVSGVGALENTLLTNEVAQHVEVMLRDVNSGAVYFGPSMLHLLLSNPPVDIGQLAANDSRDIELAWKIDPFAGNEIQDDSVDFKIQFMLHQ